jgi:hypothetical protein
VNSDQNRSYPFTFTISAANTFEAKTVTILGDTSGTWLTNNGRGITLAFNLGSGSTYSGTANTWAGALYFAPTGATSVVGTNGATFYITGVQLEAGSVATPFERRDYGRELIMAQRYFEKSHNVDSRPGTTGSFSAGLNEMPSVQGSTTTTALILGRVAYRVEKRAPAGLITFYDHTDTVGGVSRNNINISNNGGQSASAADNGTSGFNPLSSSGAAANCLAFHWTASSEL